MFRSQWFQQNRTFLSALLLLFVVRGSFADQNYIPSGSMEPTIHVGDHVLVDKVAFDLHLPFTTVPLAHLGDPKRGDVITFLRPSDGMRLIKRVIGLPGDRIQIQNGFATVNGQLIPGSEAGLRGFDQVPAPSEFVYTERVGEHNATIKRTSGLARHEVLELQVPDAQYFVMGDNRDNSYDSRGWGYVPRAAIEGRAVGVIYNVAWGWPLRADPERLGLILDGD